MSSRVLFLWDRKLDFVRVLFKTTLLVSAVSLLVYVPYKYITHLHALKGLYAFMFPLSPVVAVAGIALALFPQRLLKLPLFIRAGIVSIATVWMITGLLCVPTLVGQTVVAPASGLFATFKMIAQHVFLSLSVVVRVITPDVSCGRFGERCFLASR